MAQKKTREEVIAQFVAGVSAAAPAAETTETEESDALSPSVRRLLAEKGVDASAVKGTGKGGRITKEDVEKHLKGGSAPAPVAKAEVAVPAEIKVLTTLD